MKPLIVFNRKKGDVSILILTVIISLFGILMVYSSSRYYASTVYNNEYYFVKKQLIGFLIGLVFMVFTANFNFYTLFKVKYLLMGIGVLLLLLVFTPLGVENYGAKRWISLGGFTVQPSEIAKFCYIIFIAGYFGKNPEKVKTFKGILLPLLFGGIICVLIMLEPNMRSRRAKRS